ncbi:hypothetical protein PAEPH01_0206 [Pancytospora epiphaga]|nr:hypothetical protein PAEPH01_0206 [Pancytospora epiphaga]
MIKSLGLLHVLLSLTIFGIVSASSKTLWTPPNRESPASIELREEIENYNFSYRLQLLDGWWSKRYKGHGIRPEKYFSAYRSTYDGPTLHRRPWSFIGFCDDRKKRILKHPEGVGDDRRLYGYLEYFLLKLDIPIYLPGKLDSHLDQGGMRMSRLIPKAKVDVRAFEISRHLFSSSMLDIKKRYILEAKDEIFSLTLKFMGMKLPAQSDYSGDNTYKFTNDSEFVGDVIKLTLRAARIQGNEASLFMLSLFLTLLFRRMEDGNKFVFDLSGEGKNRLYKDDGYGKSHTESVRWNTGNYKIKNNNGEYIGLSGIPAKHSRMLREIVGQLNPATSGTAGAADKVFDDLLKGAVSFHALHAECCFFWRVYYEIGLVLTDRTFSSYTWAVFSFYDEFIYKISDHEEAADKLPEPEQKKERALIDVHLVKYVALHMRILQILTEHNEYEHLGLHDLVPQCSIQ